MPPRYRTPAASSSPCNAIFSSKGDITPPWGVPSPVGANPFPASKIPAFSHPAIIPLAGKPPRVSSRYSWLILSNAAARSASSIHTRLDFPHRVQRISYPALMTAVGQHRNSERAHFCLITGFRYVHPPDRGRLMRADRGVHLHRHLGPRLAGQRDQLIDPRRPAARVALRRLPHADQRVTPAPQHQLLQAPRRRPVTLPHRLEDPAAQPPYLPLMMAPVHTIPGVTIERGQALRSVHRGVQLAHQYRHLRSLRLKGSPAHVSALAGRAPARIRPVIRAPSGRRPGPAALAFLPPFGRRHSLFGHPVPPGTSAPLTVGLPPACAYPRLHGGP